MANQFDRFLYGHENICSFILDEIEIFYHVKYTNTVVLLKKYYVYNACLYELIKCLLKIYIKLMRVALNQ